MLKRKLIIIFAAMFLFSMVSYVLIAAFGRRAPARGEEEKIIVTSFYPVYLITGNLMHEIPGIQVVNLTENHTGCLHDYQLTTKDMLLLETADLLVINGGRMELFIEQAAQKLIGLTIIDSCEGMELLAGEEHDHTHEHDSADAPSTILSGNAGAKEGSGHEETEGAVAENGHVWMELERYLMQIHTVADGLCRAFPEKEVMIRANESAYREKITALSLEYADLKERLAGVYVITFHDAFVYLCDQFDIEVVHAIDLDADSALSAGEIATIADEIRLHGIRYLFAEQGNGAIAEQIAAETGCAVMYFDPLTSGEDDRNVYLTRMRENLELLKSILD